MNQSYVSAPTDTALLARRPMESSGELEPVAIELLLILCANNQQLFEDTAAIVKTHHFDKPHEHPLRLAWWALVESRKRYAGVTFQSLMMMAQEYLRENPVEYALFTPAQLEVIGRSDSTGLLYGMAFIDIPVNETNLNLAREVLHKFCLERTIVEPLRRVLQPTPDRRIPRMQGFLDAINTQFTRITSTAVLPVFDMAPAINTPFKKASVFQPIGIPFMDTILGGQRVGDVNGILGPTGGGKAQPLNAMIMTPLGPKFMADMRVGTAICAPDGTTTTVTGVFPQGNLDVYEVRFTDGSKTKCCGDHLWQIDAIMDGWSGRVVSTRDLVGKVRAPSGRAKYSVIVPKPLDMVNKPVPLDPYLLGVLLGDGGLSGRGVIVSTADEEILASVSELLPEGYCLTKKPQAAYDYRIQQCVRDRRQKHHVRLALESLDLMGKRSFEKRIPDVYLYNDTPSRWALLQGLMDTDGAVMLYPNRGDRCRLEFTTTSEELHKQFIWLVQSLGGLATVNVKITEKYRPAYRICVKFDDPSQCFRLSRKKERCRPRIKYAIKRVISEIKLVSNEPCQCISVAHPSKLYVTDSCIVTHNTTTALDMAVNMAKQSWLEERDGANSGPVIFVTAEEAAERLRPRIWSNFFKIPRDFVETLEDWGTLSTPGNLKPYEIEMQRDQVDMLSEVERYEMWREELSAKFMTVDISGSEEFAHAGNGYLEEISSYIDRICQRVGKAPRAVFIDYAGLLAERHLSGAGTDSDDYRMLLKRMPDESRRLISAKFGTTLWLLHQLGGAVAHQSPTKPTDYSQAAECKDFANNLSVCACLGTADPQTGCRFITFPKLRYRPKEGLHPVIIKIHPTFSYLMDVGSQFQVDAASRQFVSVSEMASVGGLDQATRRTNEGRVADGH